MFNLPSRILVSLLLASLGAGCTFSVPLRMDPEFAAGKHTVKKVAILPPDVQYQLIHLNGNRERQPKKEQQLRSELETKISRSLEGRGYEVRRYVPEEAEKKLVGANSVVEQIKGAYRSAAAKVLYVRPVSDAESRKFRVTIGSVGNDLGKLLDADAFLLTGHDAYGSSKGLAAVEMVTAVVSAAAGGSATGSVPLPNMELALVDAMTGNILWANRAHISNPRILLFSFPKRQGLPSLGQEE